MPDGPQGGPQVRAGGALVHHDDGRLLVVQRGREPARGRWSLPGGRVEPGETTEAAIAREVLEETGLEVTVGRFVGVVDVPWRGGRLRVHDHLASLDSGTLVAGDDAAAARWVTQADLEELAATDGVTDGLLAFLDEHGVGPRI